MDKEIEMPDGGVTLIARATQYRMTRKELVWTEPPRSVWQDNRGVEVVC